MNQKNNTGPEEFNGDFEDDFDGEFGDEFEDSFVDDVVEELQEDLEAMTNYAASADASLFTATMIIADQRAELSRMSFENFITSIQMAIAKDLLEAAVGYISKAEAEKDEKRRAEELAAKINALRNKPEMANLPVERREVYLSVDNVAITIKVRPETREMLARTTFDPWGDPSELIVTSTAKADVYVELPFLGKVKVDGNMTYTDTSFVNSTRHAIKNVIQFTVNIGGRDRSVKIEASGMVNDAGYGWEYGVDVTVDGQLCKRCGGNHGDPLHFEGLIS